MTMIETRERPILFSGPMVRAILDGRKTQTRRVTKVTSDGCPSGMITPLAGFVPRTPEHHVSYCPFGSVGDRLWVRETWRAAWDPKFGHGVIYKSDGAFGFANGIDAPCRDGYEWIVEHYGCDPRTEPWRPSIHMPRWASRLTLEITGVKVERIQVCSHADAIAEGIESHDDDGAIYYGPFGRGHADPRFEFRRRWDALNAKRGYGWDVNPWVWVLSFRRIDA